jgi:hypothetical protein
VPAGLCREVHAGWAIRTATRFKLTGTAPTCDEPSGRPASHGHPRQIARIAACHDTPARKREWIEVVIAPSDESNGLLIASLTITQDRGSKLFGFNSTFRVMLLRGVSRSVIRIMLKFLLPGSRANAARHFLCQAPAKLIDGEVADHAAGSLARSSIRSSARTGTRNRRPIFIIGISPRAAAS